MLTEKDQETTSEESKDNHEDASLTEGDLKATSDESKKKHIVLRGTVSCQSEEGHWTSFDTSCLIFNSVTYFGHSLTLIKYIVCEVSI